MYVDCNVLCFAHFARSSTHWLGPWYWLPEGLGLAKLLASDYAKLHPSLSKVDLHDF